MPLGVVFSEKKKDTISCRKYAPLLYSLARLSNGMQTATQVGQQVTLSTVMQGMKVRLSTLWLFAVLNYVYCDVVTLENPSYLQGLIAGTAAGIQVTPLFLLGAGILVEIPIAMVLLSRVMKHRGNRWANIIAGGLMTVIQGVSLLVSTPGLYYVFFSAIEIATTLAIVWYALRWRGLPSPQVGSAPQVISR